MSADGTHEFFDNVLQNVIFWLAIKDENDMHKIDPYRMKQGFNCCFSLLNIE